MLTQRADDFLQIYGLLLSSDHKNEYFQTAAQLIRLQEKVLEKVDKFGEPSDNTLALIVVDCSNIHSGMLDDEDVRMTAYGKPRQGEYQEYFRGLRLKASLKRISRLGKPSPCAERYPL